MEKLSMDPLYYILGGVEALIVGTVLVRLRTAIRDPCDRPQKNPGPILLFDPRSKGSEDRKEAPSRT